MLGRPPNCLEARPCLWGQPEPQRSVLASGSSVLPWVWSWPLTFIFSASELSLQVRGVSVSLPISPWMGGGNGRGEMANWQQRREHKEEWRKEKKTDFWRETNWDNGRKTKVQINVGEQRAAPRMVVLAMGLKTKEATKVQEMEEVLEITSKTNSLL